MTPTHDALSCLMDVVATCTEARQAEPSRLIISKELWDEVRIPGTQAGNRFMGIPIEIHLAKPGMWALAIA